MLKDIKQKRLAAREELKAVLHTLSLAGMELHKPDHVLRPVDTSSGELRLLKGNKPFLWNPSTGNGQWDYVWDCSALRLVVSPDEGGPLWSAFLWLSSRGHKVHFVRDELRLICITGFHAPFQFSRYVFLSPHISKLYLSTLPFFISFPASVSPSVFLSCV